MIRVALKGLAARPLRTALTALAIVLGVAMVSARVHAHRHDARRGRLAVARRLRRHGRRRHRAAPRSTVDAERLDAPGARRSTPRCSTRVRAVPQVARRRRRHHRRGQDHRPRRQAGRRRPVLRRRASTPARRAPSALTPFRLDAGRWADRRRARSSSTPATADEAALRGRLDTVRIATRGAARDVHGRRHRALRHRQVARHRDVRRVRPAHRAGAVRQGRPLRLDPRRRPRRRRPRADVRAAVAAGARPQRAGRRPPRRRTASRSTGLKQFIAIIRIVAARVRRRGGPRRRVHDLQHALDHRRPAHARARAAADGRRGAPPGARLGAARGAGDRRARLASSGLAAGFGLAEGPGRVFASIGLDAAGGGHGVRARGRSSSRCSSARS